MTKLLRFGVLLVPVLVIMASCSSRDAVTIYSGRDEALVGPLLDRFAEERDIAIDVRYGDSADLALLIEQEGEDTPADVFFSQSPGTVGFLSDNGLLASLPDDLVDKVPSEFESSTEEWVGVTARQRVLVYNEEMVDEADLPSSVLDLTGEAYRGRVGLAPQNGSFQDFITAMRQLEGEDVAREWLEGMADNGSPTYPDNSSIVDAVARGEIPMGLVNHYYNFRYLDEDPDAPSRNYIFPGDDVGALLIASTVSVLEPSDDPRAVELVEFLLEDETQEYFAEETFEYPLVEGIEPAADLPPLASLDVPDYSIQDLGGGLERTVELIAESGLDS
ncbi:MAG: iron ABC transporter substrate-binding protein [Actinomycetota bacterium]